MRAIALSEPLLLDRLISPDGTTTAVNVTLTLPLLNESETPEAMAYARDLAEQFRQDHPDVRVAVTGLVALNNAFTESSFRDLATLVPLMYGALLLTMIVLLRSFSGTVATMSVIGLSAATAMGLAGWLGIQLSPPSSIAPTIILTIAVADSIHVLVTMFKEMRDGHSKRAALVESVRVNFQPVFLTSLTTVIGFLSLNFSDAPPFGIWAISPQSALPPHGSIRSRFCRPSWRCYPCVSSPDPARESRPWIGSPSSSLSGGSRC